MSFATSKHQVPFEEIIMRRETDYAFTNGADRSPARGLIAGLTAGLAATWVMTHMQSAMSAAAESMEPEPEPEPDVETADAEPADGSADEPATTKAASAVSERVFDHRLTDAEKRIASPAVHYGFGTLAGGLYGLLAERSPVFATGAGLGFGTALWLGADEVGVPLAGLSDPPQDVPASTHARSLAAHLVYGLTAEVIRRGVRRML
jgi:hypothetical protein